MNFWKKLFGGSEISVAENNEKERSFLIEDIVSRLQGAKPSKPYCYAVLFGDRPLTGKMGGDESIMIFSDSGKANDFITGYQSYYRTTKPLSVLAVGSADDLWCLLNNQAKDPLYKTPYGLIINFNYAGKPYNAYSIEQIHKFGKEGIKKGLNQVL